VIGGAETVVVVAKLALFVSSAEMAGFVCSGVAGCMRQWKRMPCCIVLRGHTSSTMGEKFVASASPMTAVPSPAEAKAVDATGIPT
jgi:hypothetical protein